MKEQKEHEKATLHGNILQCLQVFLFGLVCSFVLPSRIDDPT